MPLLKKRSDEDGARVDELLTKAQTQTLKPEEVKELMWVLIPFFDLPAGYIDGRQFYFDGTLGMLYEKVGDERHYVLVSEDKLSSFGVGGGGGGVVNRGGGPFARLAVDNSKLKVPLPEFPTVPENVKSKFPELKDEWDKWESAVGEWVRNVQNALN